ncbi:MAG TPA: glycosyltransferase family 4 protein [Verrucomicrobiae bacterium]|nr:glycosyltransferase family 4 protein [Verrucomicrobiae bacterium]
MALMTDEPPATSKIIFVTHEFAPFRGGVATFVEEVGRTSQRKGASVEIWAPDYGLPQSTQMDCPVVRLRAEGSLKWKHLTQLTRALAERRAELEGATVVMASVGAHIAFMMLAISGRVKMKSLVSVLYGSEVLRFGRNPIWRLLAWRLYRRVEGIVTISEFSRNLIEHSFLSSFRGTIEIAPCACSSDAMRNVTAKKIEDGKVRIFTLARIHPRKGQLDTALALGRLPAELRSRVVYQIGGTGDSSYLKKISQTCAQAGVAFEYLGEVKPESLADAYAQCDIFAMTSRRLPRSVEGFGITYLDAAFHGNPVVAFKSGGAEEAVRDGETGLLAEEGDLAAVTDIFARLIADAGLRERLGAAGRERARQQTWATAAAVFLRFRG